MTADHDGKFLASARREPAFISRWFTYWKKKTTAFKKHQSCNCHKEATEAIVIVFHSRFVMLKSFLVRHTEKRKPLTGGCC